MDRTMESSHMYSTKFMRNSKAVGVLWGIFSVCYAIIVMVVFTQVSDYHIRKTFKSVFMFRMNGLVMEICLKFLVILDYGGGVWTGCFYLVIIYNLVLIYSVIMTEKNAEAS
jgi:hypothetical protein